MIRKGFGDDRDYLIPGRREVLGDGGSAGSSLSRSRLIATSGRVSLSILRQGTSRPLGAAGRDPLWKYP